MRGSAGWSLSRYLRARNSLKYSQNPDAIEKMSKSPTPNCTTAGLKDEPSHHSLSQFQMKMRITILTGGFDRPYAYGLAMALADSGLELDVIGSDEIDSPELRSNPRIRFLNLQPGWRSGVSFWRKLIRVAALYFRLVVYLARSESSIVHILWNNKLTYIDRTVLMIYHKLLGKRVTLTAHNVNTAKRDGTDSWLNRVTLWTQYRLADRIFVHTQKMKNELISEFRVQPQAVQVIPFGINNAVRHTSLKPQEAKARLGIPESDPTLLFFGRIQPYKGLEYLVEAVEQLNEKSETKYRLIIAGAPKKEHVEYWNQIKRLIERGAFAERVIQHIQFIPDDETEVYFKAADVFVLPYTEIYQSGVLFLGYSFGLPVIASDVGGFADEIVCGETGWLSRPADAGHLAATLERHFSSPLYSELDLKRSQILAFARSRYSWEEVGNQTLQTYGELAWASSPIKAE